MGKPNSPVAPKICNANFKLDEMQFEQGRSESKRIFSFQPLVFSGAMIHSSAFRRILFINAITSPNLAHSVLDRHLVLLDLLRIGLFQVTILNTRMRTNCVSMRKNLIVVQNSRGYNTNEGKNTRYPVVYPSISTYCVADSTLKF